MSAFPPACLDMQTFMAWVKWNGGAEWQRIYDFGNDTNFYSVLTPEASSGDLRFNISVDSIPGEQVIDAPGPLPVGVWTHVAVVMNGILGHSLHQRRAHRHQPLRQPRSWKPQRDQYLHWPEPMAGRPLLQRGNQ